MTESGPNSTTQTAQPLVEGQVVSGTLFSEPMRVETIKESGSGTWVVGLCGINTEKFRRVTLTIADFAQLQIQKPQATYQGDGHILRIGVQAYSLGIAYEFDPYFGLSISRVDPLPHQLEAVYDYLLKLARVRFLLADDAGAGKTIMAGLLIRELKLRGLAERILIICPANLAFQWQRELKEKFEEKFVVLKGDSAALATSVHLVCRPRPDNAGIGDWAEVLRELTIGSAPLESQTFRAAVLGQLGESRLLNAIEADIAGQASHAMALDADTSGQLRDIHRRVATAILFESSGGQTDKSAHLPELRFALGEPGIDTTNIDNAAALMESRGFFIRRKGADGFQFGFKPTLKKVVNDRRASLDEEEVTAEARRIVQKEFERGKILRVIPFPEDGTAVQDTTKLVLVVMSPDHEWADDGSTKKTIYEWTRNRGHSPRLYPGSLIWCIRKQGRDLRTKVETLLAWRIVERDFLDGSLAGEFDAADREEIQVKRRDAEGAVDDEVWAGYRYVVLYDPRAESGVTVIDLGAGHANAGETLSGRVVSTLKSRALLNDSPGAGYLVRRWPEPFKKSGAWPLSALRQAFLNGTMERLLEPDDYIKHKFPEFIFNGDFGYASGAQEGGYYRIWFEEELRQDEISFDSDVYLLLPTVAKELTTNAAHPTVIVSPINPETPEPTGEVKGPLFPSTTEETSSPTHSKRTITVRGEIPTEVWNRLGRTLIPKLKMGGDLSVGLNVSVEVEADTVQGFQTDLLQILQDLNIADTVKVELK